MRIPICECRVDVEALSLVFIGGWKVHIGRIAAMCPHGKTYHLDGFSSEPPRQPNPLLAEVGET